MSYSAEGQNLEAHVYHDSKDRQF